MPRSLHDKGRIYSSVLNWRANVVVDVNGSDEVCGVQGFGASGCSRKPVDLSLGSHDNAKLCKHAKQYTMTPPSRRQVLAIESPFPDVTIGFKARNAASTITGGV